MPHFCPTWRAVCLVRVAPRRREARTPGRVASWLGLSIRGAGVEQKQTKSGRARDCYSSWGLTRERQMPVGNWTTGCWLTWHRVLPRQWIWSQRTCKWRLSRDRRLAPTEPVWIGSKQADANDLNQPSFSRPEKRHPRCSNAAGDFAGRGGSSIRRRRPGKTGLRLDGFRARCLRNGTRLVPKSDSANEGESDASGAEIPGAQLTVVPAAAPGSPGAGHSTVRPRGDEDGNTARPPCTSGTEACICRRSVA